MLAAAATVLVVKHPLARAEAAVEQIGRPKERLRMRATLTICRRFENDELVARFDHGIGPRLHLRLDQRQMTTQISDWRQ